MAVSDDVMRALEGHLPLRIVAIDYSDPSVSFIGSKWALSLVCPWRVVQAGERLFAWDDADVADALVELIEQSIVEVRQRSSEAPWDPVFILSNGFEIEIFADSDLDPWVLRLPDQTFVGQAHT